MSVLSVFSVYLLLTSDLVVTQVAAAAALAIALPSVAVGLFKYRSEKSQLDTGGRSNHPE